MVQCTLLRRLQHRGSDKLAITLLEGYVYIYIIVIGSL